MPSIMHDGRRQYTHISSSSLSSWPSPSSAGDLSFHENSLFLTSVDKKLMNINKSNGAPISSKLHNITDLFGLVSTGTDKLCRLRPDQGLQAQ
jgi:hypothetical protein